jgi:hypothetical protein
MTLPHGSVYVELVLTKLYVPSELTIEAPISFVERVLPKKSRSGISVAIAVPLKADPDVT